MMNQRVATLAIPAIGVGNLFSAIGEYESPTAQIASPQNLSLQVAEHETTVLAGTNGVENKTHQTFGSALATRRWDPALQQSRYINPATSENIQSTPSPIAAAAMVASAVGLTGCDGAAGADPAMIAIWTGFVLSIAGSVGWYQYSKTIVASLPERFRESF